MQEHTHAMSRRTFIGASAIAGLSTCLLAPETQRAFAVTSAEKKAEAAAVYEKLQAMEEKLDAASADYGTAIEEQQAAQAKMDEAQERIDEANVQIADLQEQLGTRARGMYRSGSLSVIDLLLGATSFQAFTTNWDVLNQMNQNDSDMVEETKSLRAEVQAQKDEYAAQEAVAAAKAEEAAQVKAEAEELVSEMQSTYDSLTAEAARLLEEEEEARRRAEEERARAAAQRNSWSNSVQGSGGVDNNKSQTVTGNVVVDRAYSQIGCPYVWGAVGPGSYDCSGLVSYAILGRHERLGTTYTFMTYTQVTDPQPGDICTHWTHCGIYVGGGMMIHASVSRGVVEAPVHAGMIFVRY